MMPAFNTFAEFSWISKHTPEQFASQIGGIVNLYLGSSGLSVVALVITLVGKIKKWREQKKMERTGGGSPANELMEKMANGKEWRNEKWFNDLKEMLRAELKEEFQK